MIPLPSWEMITIQNFRMFPGFLLVVLPLLWLGSCVLTWIVLFVPFSQPNILGESVKAVFSLFSPFFSVAILVIMLNIWFGRRIYEVRNGWLHTEKRLFGLRWDAFDYDPDLLSECSMAHMDEHTTLNGMELERLRHAGAVIRRRGKMGTEYPASCWVCRLVYDEQILFLHASPSQKPVGRLAEFMETVIRTHREKHT